MPAHHHSQTSAAIAGLMALGTLLAGSDARADEDATSHDVRTQGEDTSTPRAQSAQSALPAQSAQSAQSAQPARPSTDKPACEHDDDGECTCDTKCCGGWRHRCTEPSVSLSVIGVRPAFTNLSTDTRSSREIGVGFAGAVDSYALSGKSHGSMQWMLGGGQAGFEGQLAGVVEFGHRIDVTEHQGPFGRIGFDGRLQGNDAFYYSALELPRLTAGWQFATKRTVLELGARGGPILTGRFNPGDGVRSTTGSWEFGGIAAAQVEFLRIEATAFRMDGRNTGDHTPVDVGRGTFCAVMGRLGICGDFMALSGTANMGTPAAVNMQDALVTYMGVTLGASRW